LGGSQPFVGEVGGLRIKMWVARWKRGRRENAEKDGGGLGAPVKERGLV